MSTPPTSSALPEHPGRRIRPARSSAAVVGLALILTVAHLPSVAAQETSDAPGLPGDRRVLVAGDRSFPPFEFVDDEGRPAGYNVDLTLAVARAVDLDVTIRLDTWSSVRERLERGEVDALQGMFYSLARDRELDFTAPHATVHYVAVVREGDGPAPASFDGLGGLGVVVQRDDIIHDILRSRGLDPVQPVGSQVEALRRLSRGEHDVAVVARATALYCIDRYGLDNLEVGRTSLHSSDYCFAVPEGNGALLAELSEGLRLLERSGEYREIQERWMGIDQPRQVTLGDALRRSALILAPLFLVLLVAFLWSWLLRRQVAARTAALRESERRLTTLLDNLQGMAYRCRNDRRWTMDMVSEGCRTVTGYDPDEVVGSRVVAYGDLIHPDDRDRVWSEVQAAVSAGAPFALEYRIVPRGGDVRWVWEKGRAVETADDGPAMLEGFVTDVTKRRALEERLRQAQKMEAVGRLAGGLAHDYNNMLSVIIGNAELAREALPVGAAVRDDLEEILAAARRSAELTRQLLGFARKQTAAPRRLDVNDAVGSMLTMLRRLAGEGVELRWRPGADLWPVRIDPSQLDQVVANLCVSARDAVGGIGLIEIETANVSIDDEACSARPGVAVGDYVVLAVSDDGPGMDREIVERLFEPFGAEEAGRGAGLGLATVYGIVTQNDGLVDVASEPDDGTTVRVCLPRYVEPHPPAAQPQEPERAGELRGRATVLLVEDEPAIVEVLQRGLEQLGYEVLATTSPREAVELAEAHAGAIDLLLTDVVMPGMDGGALAERIGSVFPGIRVLYMSGYTADVVTRHGILEEDVDFLQKPFALDELVEKVASALDRDGGAGR